jgi:hypothetical protein
VITKKTKIAIDNWENRTSVFIHFGDDISIEGTFSSDELSSIASIQRKRLKELSPSLVKTEQKGLFDD